MESKGQPGRDAEKVDEEEWRRGRRNLGELDVWEAQREASQTPL